jgi:hypothetical protein
MMKMSSVVMSASSWPEPRNRSESPSPVSGEPISTAPVMIAIQVGKNPDCWPSASQLKNPATSCWLTPAMMNSPTPEPTPHLLTISSMNRMSTPPTKICAKISVCTPPMPIPRAPATCGSAGRNPPANTIGSPVRITITITSSFCSPW